MRTRFGRSIGGTSPLFLALAIPLLILLYGLLLHQTLGQSYQGANDFFIPWYAVRALLLDGADPYGELVTREIQQVLFGGPRAEGEHQFDFAYPLTVLPVLAPFVALPYPWAQSLWQATLHACLVAGVWLWSRSWRHQRVTPMLLLIMILWLLSSYPAARAFILGQIAVVVFLTAALAVWALEEGRGGLAGVALALATIKPQISFLLVPFLLWLAWRRGRTGVVRAFIITLAALLLFSLLVEPAWPLSFLQRLQEYAQYTDAGAAIDSPNPLSYLLRLAGPDLPLLELALMAALLLALLAWLIRKGKHASWVAVASLLLLISGWLAPRTATTDQVLLLLPFLWLCTFLTPRVALLLAGGLWLLQWGAFFGTLSGNTEHLAVRLLLPVVLTALWLWLRPPASAPVDHTSSEVSGTARSVL